jgi:hypothetical protein
VVFTNLGEYKIMSKENYSASVTTQSSQGVFPISKMVKGKLIFENTTHADMAYNIGAFYLKIPEHIDMEPGTYLAQNFHKDLDSNMPDFTGYKQHPFEKSSFGYVDRPDQVEQFQLELSLWAEYLPKKVCDVVSTMNMLSVQVLENMLEYYDIPKEDWAPITGGSLENKAGHLATISHYRPEKKAIGIVGHKDGGYITLLYSTTPGYEVKIGDEWHSMDPKEGYFIVNLGQSFEILTANCKKRINAPEHRVRQLYSGNGVEDRTSVAIFVTPRLDSDIYQYNVAGSLEVYRDYLSFLKERFRKINYVNDRVDGLNAASESNTSKSGTPPKFSELYDD